MEDAATAEICRSQLWQWRTTGTKLDDGRRGLGRPLPAIRDEELARLGGPDGRHRPRSRDAAEPARSARPRRRLRRVPDAPRLLAARLIRRAARGHTRGVTTTEVDPAQIAMFDQVMVAFYTEARRREWADIKIDDDVIWGSTGIPGPAFNGATAATFSDDTADARIETILDYFRELRIDMSWWVGPTRRRPTSATGSSPMA